MNTPPQAVIVTKGVQRVYTTAHEAGDEMGVQTLCYLREQPDLLPVGDVVKRLDIRLTRDKLLVVADCSFKVTAVLSQEGGADGDSHRFRCHCRVVLMDPSYTFDIRFSQSCINDRN